MKGLHYLPYLVLIGIVPFVFTLPSLISMIGAQSTGVCIFKGAPFYSSGIFGGTSSSGIPLRGIGVTAWHPGGFGGQIIDHTGSTDRTGCFIFKTNSAETMSYTYNGTGYVDNVDSGVVLQDNLP